MTRNGCWNDGLWGFWVARENRKKEGEGRREREREREREKEGRKGE